MPSPIIPRSKSAPDIISPHSPSDVLNSSRSVRSTRSTGSPITSWPKIVGGYIKGEGKNSNLTEKSLQEFNRRNALVEARYNSSSPYYKGLTNFSLVISRERLSCSSPGRESHATSYISSGSKSSFVVRMQGWGSSCFTSGKHEKSSSSSWTRGSDDARFMSSSSSTTSKFTETGVAVTKIRTKTMKNDSEPERKKVTFRFIKNENTIISSTTEKPLGERDSETPSMLPLPPPTASPPESLPYPLPHITPPSASLPDSLPYPLPHITPPAAQVMLSTLPAVRLQVLDTCPSPDMQAPKPESPATEPLPDVQVPKPENPAAEPSPDVQVTKPESPAAEGATHENKEINTNENERVYAWANRYRPFWLQDFLCNKRTALWLQNMARNWQDATEECGHFIFEGNPGVGKRTMIWALLREIFGQDQVQAREECKKFHLKGEAVGSILVNLMVSPQHVELNLSELKGYEKHVLVDLIKEKSLTPDTTSQGNQVNCKAIVLYEAEKLSTDSLLYIKWVLEKFKGRNKVFFCCSDAKKLQAIKPLCTYVQLLEPSIEEILEVLAKIAKEENIQLSDQLANKIANNSKNNLRQAIRSFEATWLFNGCSALLTEDQVIKTGWEDKIANIAKNVVEEQSPKQLYNIRGELQNLIEHNVAPECIFQSLKEELEKILPGHLQPQFVHLYVEYQKNNASKKYFSYGDPEEELGKTQSVQRKNVQQFMRIEEFIARFMSWYKNRRFDDIKSWEAT